MTKTTELFLAEFKKLENAVKTYKNSTVLDFENGLTVELTKEHLKMCRIARNHIVHSDDSFFEPSKKMIAFLSDLTREVSLSAGSAKDMMVSFTKFGYVTLSSTIEDAISVISSKHLGSIPVLSDDMMSCVFVRTCDLCGVIYENGKFRQCKMKTVVNDIYSSNNVANIADKQGIPVIKMDTPTDDIPAEPFVFVCDNKNRLKGIIVQ